MAMTMEEIARDIVIAWLAKTGGVDAIGGRDLERLDAKEQGMRLGKLYIAAFQEITSPTGD